MRAQPLQISGKKSGQRQRAADILLLVFNGDELGGCREVVTLSQCGITDNVDISNEDDYECAAANHEADELAVEHRQQLHAKPDAAIKQRLEEQLTFQKKLLRMIGEPLCMRFSKT